MQQNNIFMKTLYSTICIITLLTSCKGQSNHKDLMEYGYKGKVKTIVRKDYANVDSLSPLFGLIENDTDLFSTKTYYYNTNGNIDSMVTEMGRIIYEFNNFRKSAFTVIDNKFNKILSGKIIWNSDKEFKELTYSNNLKLKYETKTFLNDSFRIIKTEVKGLDSLGNITQNDIQQFSFDSSSRIKFYTKISQIDNSNKKTNYEYLENDKYGNPTKLVISNEISKTLVILEYKYYD